MYTYVTYITKGQKWTNLFFSCINENFDKLNAIFFYI